MSSDSDIPSSSEDEVLAPDHFSVTIARDGTTSYEFPDQPAVERFFGTRIVTTPEALREVVREVRPEQRRATTSKRPPENRTGARSARGRKHKAEDTASSTNALNESFPDDAIINQRSILVFKSTYLRLARQGAFPSRKIGKLIFARWGDVKRSFLNAQSSRQGRPVSTAVSPEGDGLDDLRRQLGLRKKGK